MTREGVNKDVLIVGDYSVQYYMYKSRYNHMTNKQTTDMHN